MRNIIITSSRNGGSALIAESVYKLANANQLLNDPYTAALAKQQSQQLAKGFSREFATPFELAKNLDSETAQFLINNVYAANDAAPYNCFWAAGKIALMFAEFKTSLPGTTWIFSKRDVQGILDRSIVYGIPLVEAPSVATFDTERARLEESVLSTLQTIEEIVAAEGATWVYVDGRNPVDEDLNPIMLTEFDPNNVTHIEIAIVRT